MDDAADAALERFEEIDDPVARLAAMREVTAVWWAPYPEPLPLRADAIGAAVDDVHERLTGFDLDVSALAHAADLADEGVEAVLAALEEMAESVVAGEAADAGDDGPGARAGDEDAGGAEDDPLGPEGVWALLAAAFCIGARAAAAATPSHAGGAFDGTAGETLGAVVTARVLAEWEAGVDGHAASVDGAARSAAVVALAALAPPATLHDELVRWALGAFDLGVLARRVDVGG